MNAPHKKGSCTAKVLLIVICAAATGFVCFSGGSGTACNAGEVPATHRFQQPPQAEQQDAVVPPTRTVGIHCPKAPMSGFVTMTPQYLSSILQENPHSTIVIIGANVGGTSTDPQWPMLAKFASVRKIFVEPIPALFHRLKVNAERDGITNAVFVNKAIGNVTGDVLKLWCFKMNDDGSVPDWMQPWMSEMCSSVLYKIKDNWKPYANAFSGMSAENRDRAIASVTPIEVTTVTVADLFAEHVPALDQVSYVQVDTEGYDYNVMLQLPFNDKKRFKPCLLNWEHIQLHSYQLVSLGNLLGYRGYAIWAGGVSDQSTSAVRSEDVLDGPVR